MFCLDEVNICNSNVFSVVNMYLAHLKFYVLMVEGMSVVVNIMLVSNECDEPTPCFMRPIGTQGGEAMHFGSFCFRGGPDFLNYDDICICV